MPHQLEGVHATMRAFRTKIKHVGHPGTGERTIDPNFHVPDPLIPHLLVRPTDSRGKCLDLRRLYAARISSPRGMQPGVRMKNSAYRRTVARPHGVEERINGRPNLLRRGPGGRRRRAGLCTRSWYQQQKYRKERQKPSHYHGKSLRNGRNASSPTIACRTPVLRTVGTPERKPVVFSCFAPPPSSPQQSFCLDQRLCFTHGGQNRP